jgi:hypothetical protein
MLTKEQFFRDVMDVVPQYEDDNAWFRFERGGIWDKGHMIQFILMAWRCYQGVTRNALQTILLGDTKIRSDAQLVMSFGLASAGGVQEEKDREMVQKLMDERRRPAKAGPATDVVGPGSILSTKMWSPILNDALIIAGAHGRQDFLFALNEDERQDWGLHIGAAEFDKRRAVFGEAVKRPGAPPASPPAPGAKLKERWASFFRRNPRIFWDRGNPRVFVRELIGLKFFGYSPEFSDLQLGFACTNPGAANVASFRTYLQGLRALGFHSRDRLALMGAVSEFLFEDRAVLQGIGA